MLKKIISQLLINSILIAALITIYIQLPASYQSLDNRLRDFMFITRGQQQDSGTILIVTIDEESLQELGQWPWERNKIAQMLHNLSIAGASVIGMDVFFAEKDKTSPKNIITSLPPALQQNILDNYPDLLDDYDQIMANKIGETPTILGYIFDLKNTLKSDQFPMLNATISEKNFTGTEFLPIAKGAVLNLELFQNKAISSGFINNIPDASGMIRRVPLLIKYEEIVFTSLALEVFRLHTGINHINLNYLPTGISSIDLENHQYSSRVPTDRYGRLFLNFLGPGKSFDYLSAKDVIANQFDPNLVKDKIILFGATAVGLMDLRATPFDNALAGIEVHATAIENMLQKNYLSHPDWSEGATTLIIIGLLLLLTLLYSLLPAYLIILLMGSSLYGLYFLFDYLLFQQGLILNLLFPLLSIIVLTIGSTLSNYFLENRQRKLIRDKFSQKVSSAVVDEILSQSDNHLLIAQEKEVSIFFSDIRGFTHISETLGSPSKLIDLLNIYMTPMVDNIMLHQGTVDKFIGDAIMAYWNAPHPINNHADTAIKSALQQLKQLNKVNKILQKKYKLSIDIGIGINTGQVTVGEMGSRGRSDYTIIGDAVNLASRLEGLNKVYGCRLIISEFTLQQTQQEYVIRLLDKVRVKGKSEGISIYEVLAKGIADSVLQEELTLYHMALNRYYQSDFMTAKQQFDYLIQDYAKNTLYILYSQRCQDYITHPPSHFDGIFTHTSK